MTYVRDGQGVPLLCCWDDCEKLGHEEHKVIRTERTKRLHYVFCSETHRQLYLTSPVSHGNLAPSGPRRSPLGLILP